MRSSSLPEDEDGDMEIMRHFVADDRKVFNRGDSLRRREKSDRQERKIIPSEEKESWSQGRRHFIQCSALVERVKR